MTIEPRHENKATRVLRALLDVKRDECILWPLGATSNGYGKMKYRGRTRGAHVVALELTVGPKPADKDVAAHSCRNRHCVNPRHLRWATTSENHHDKWRDGTMPHGETSGVAVLTVDIVRQIRGPSALGFTPLTISRQLRIDKGTTRDVLAGRTWSHVDRGAA